MRIRYIARPNSFRGKYMMELLAPLKNFGVGRLLVRSIEARYPEPCYYVVRKVEPQMTPELNCGHVWVDRIFRGEFEGTHRLENGIQADYRLVPRDAEEAVRNKFDAESAARLPKKSVIPSTVAFPPILRLVEQADARQCGRTPYHAEEGDDEPRLPLKLRRAPHLKVLQEGVEVPLGSYDPDAPPNTMIPQSVEGTTELQRELKLEPLKWLAPRTYY